MTTIPFHHILLKSPLLADAVLNELGLGARFEDLAAEHSACPSGKNQGFAGNQDVDDLPEEIYEALAKYDGSSPWIGPVKSRYGFHIIRPAGQIGDVIAEMNDRVDDVSGDPDDAVSEDLADISPES